MFLQKRWTIIARVTNKSAIRHYERNNSKGIYFNVKLIDDTGEILATGFNEECDKFYELLKNDNVSIKKISLIIWLFL